MKFTKMQGAGNDFIVVETNNMPRNWSALAIAMCDRHYGIGADGLLLLLPSEVANFKMRMLNPDGSESATCGNGLRCLVKYFVERGLANAEARQISVETMAGIRKAEIYKETGKITKIKSGMGQPKLAAEDIPVIIASDGGNIVDIKSLITYSLTVDGSLLPLSLVSMGNPHAVYFSPDSVSNFSLSRFGPKIEQHQIFPRGTNFEVVWAINRQLLEARVWERGAGETLACGSGACAIAVAARLLGYIDNKVDVKLPGGILEVEWDGIGEVYLSGPAETVFSGEWPDERSYQE